jgi:flagellar biosynthesis protein FliR
METFTPYLSNFLFILLRVGIAVSMLPFISSTNFPAQFRIGLAVAMALILSPVITFQVSKPDIPAVVLREIMFGSAFGFSIRFIFFAVDAAGQIMSNATGLSMASMFIPEFGQSTEVSQLYSIVATLLFFTVDAHHDMIMLFVKSYEWVPAGMASVHGLLAVFVTLSGKVFIIALKLSAPVLIIMVITNLILGFISKAVPQMNVFFVGQPLHLFLGFLTMLVSLPVFAYVMSGYFKGISGDVGRLMLMMKQ